MMLSTNNMLILGAVLAVIGIVLLIIARKNKNSLDAAVIKRNKLMNGFGGALLAIGALVLAYGGYTKYGKQGSVKYYYF